MASKNYRDLIAWQKSMDFMETVYRATRVAVSIPSNIAEGQGRRTDPEFAHRSSIAHGSVREAETQLMIAARLSHLQKEAVERGLEEAGKVGRLITGLRNSMVTNDE